MTRDMQLIHETALEIAAREKWESEQEMRRCFRHVVNFVFDTVDTFVEQQIKEWLEQAEIQLEEE